MNSSTRHRPFRLLARANGGVRKLCRAGLVSVELAITAPLLFLLILASIEFGRMNTIRHTVSSAAYEAARRGLILNGDAADCLAQANAIMQTVGAKDVQISLDPPVIDIQTPRLTVTVTVPANSNGFLSAQFFADKQSVGVCTLNREVVNP